MDVRWAQPMKGCDSIDTREQGGKRTRIADHELGAL